jgi:hypothetical protein
MVANSSTSRSVCSSRAGALRSTPFSPSANRSPAGERVAGTDGSHRTRHPLEAAKGMACVRCGRSPQLPPTPVASLPARPFAVTLQTLCGARPSMVSTVDVASTIRALRVRRSSWASGDNAIGELSNSGRLIGLRPLVPRATCETRVHRRRQRRSPSPVGKPNPIVRGGRREPVWDHPAAPLSAPRSRCTV